MFNRIINGLPIAIAFGLVGYWAWNQLPKQSQAANLNLDPIDQKQEYEPPMDKWDVVSIHDGDTIRIKRGSEEKKVRFACIDAPELSQPMGVKSRDYLRSLIVKSGNKVSVKIVDVDRYGRSVAEVWAGDELVQSLMAGAGMVYSYDRYKQNSISRLLARVRALIMWIMLLLPVRLLLLNIPATALSFDVLIFPVLLLRVSQNRSSWLGQSV